MADVQRTQLKSFWDQYESMPNIQAMMLNDKAEILKEADCLDVLQSLPDFQGMDVVDIGAGIG
jgi:hypothetical protein